MRSSRVVFDKKSQNIKKSKAYQNFNQAFKTSLVNLGSSKKRLPRAIAASIIKKSLPIEVIVDKEIIFPSKSKKLKINFPFTNTELRNYSPKNLENLIAFRLFTDIWNQAYVGFYISKAPKHHIRYQRISELYMKNRKGLLKFYNNYASEYAYNPINPEKVKSEQSYARAQVIHLTERIRSKKDIRGEDNLLNYELNNFNSPYLTRLPKRDDFNDQIFEDIFEEELDNSRPVSKEVLKNFSVEERLEGVSFEEVMQHYDVNEILDSLSMDDIQSYLDSK